MYVCTRKMLTRAMRLPTALRALQPSVLRSPLASRSLSAASDRLALIKELRARTSAPMKKCVEAIDATGGDLEEAIAQLRKAGLAAAGKKASRGANEGAVAVAHTPAALALIELNSETDFVARNEVFHALAGDLARTALSTGLGSVSSTGLLTLDLPTSELGDRKLETESPAAPGAESVNECVGVAVSQLGENLVLRRASLLLAPPEGGVVAAYVHNTYAPGIGRTAAAVALRSDAADADALRALGERIAMHVVAASPLFLSRADVPSEALDRERDILVEQARASGKPDSVVEKMVAGRINKYYSEVRVSPPSHRHETVGLPRSVLRGE